MSLVVSFDVFDTVVTRTFSHPRDVFVHLGTMLHRARGGIDPFRFAQARWAAELAVRRESTHEEVLLDDIYRTLGAKLGWSPQVSVAALALEIEIESRHLRGVPLVKPLLASSRREAGRLIFLSDMYLPSALLRSWLLREGVLEPQDLVMVSGEAKANKSSGRLFEAARRAVGGEFANWRHTGDHLFADVRSPRKLGIDARHFNRVHLTPREKAARGTTGEFAAPWRSLLAGAMRLARLECPSSTEREGVLWETAASVAGPLFLGFVRWVLADARRRRLRRLYFLARDAQIFHRVADSINAMQPSGVECRYLYASRLVFSGPAELRTPSALRELVAPNGHSHSVRQALAHLGLEESWAYPRFPAGLKTLAPEANLPPGDREALADWLLAPEQEVDLRAAVDRRTVQARAYLESEGLRAGEPVGLVDAGWLGTIQRNLEYILGDNGKPVPLTGYYLGLMPPRLPGAAGEMLGFTNQFGPLPLLREESHKVLIELMAQSDHGQVSGFEVTDGKWVPRLRDPGPVNLGEIRLFQDAVLAFSRRFLETDAEAPVPHEDFARTAIGLYRRFHDRPTRREARVFGLMPHADQVLEQRHASLCAQLQRKEVLAAIADYRKRPPHWWIQGQATFGHGLLLRTFGCLKALTWRLRRKAP